VSVLNGNCIRQRRVDPAIFAAQAKPGGQGRMSTVRGTAENAKHQLNNAEPLQIDASGLRRSRGSGLRAWLLGLPAHPGRPRKA
jgi:hypothetical protein